MRRDPFRHRNGRQGFDKGVRWIHIIDAGRKFLQLLNQHFVLVLGHDSQGPLAQIPRKGDEPGGNTAKAERTPAKIA